MGAPVRTGRAPTFSEPKCLSAPLLFQGGSEASWRALAGSGLFGAGETLRPYQPATDISPETWAQPFPNRPDTSSLSGTCSWGAICPP